MDVNLQESLRGFTRNMLAGDVEDGNLEEVG